MDSNKYIVQLIKLGRMHRKYACAMLRKEGISSGQPPLFEVLAQNEGSTQCELSRQCLLEPATITSTLTLDECETFYNISQKIINNINTMPNSDCESDPELE